jgi:hypothetical protein
MKNGDRTGPVECNSVRDRGRETKAKKKWGVLEVENNEWGVLDV